MEKLDDFDYYPLLKHQLFINIVSFGILQYGRREMLSNLELTNKKILDLMCGNQQLLSLMKIKESCGFEYLGIDLISCNYSYSSKNCKNSVRFIRHNLKLPFLHNPKSDIITCSYGLKIAIHSFEKNFLQTIINQANQNCTLSFVEFCLPENRMLKSLLKLYLELLIFICSLLQSNIKPSIKKLKSILVDKSKFDKIIKQLELAGFECTVQEKVFGLLCLIRCEREEN